MNKHTVKKVICPEFYCYLSNTYSEPSTLHINGKKKVHILSEERCTQGNNTAVSMYACSIKSLIDKLKDPNIYEDCNPTKQV